MTEKQTGRINAQLLTKCINHWADSANFKGVTFNKLCSGFDSKVLRNAQRFIHQPLPTILKRHPTPMIITRKYKPDDNDIIYHYCDAYAFYSICTNRKLWFNDLFSMNDYLELHWGYSIWEQAASTRLRNTEENF